MHKILCALRHAGELPEDCMQKGIYVFTADSVYHKLAVREMKAYMNAVTNSSGGHLAYMKEFELKWPLPPPKVKRGFQIFVKTDGGKTLTIDDVQSSDTVADLKTKILDKKEKKKRHMYPTRLIHGHQLENHRTLGDYGIAGGSTIFELGHGPGGMRPVPDPPQDSSRLFD